MMDVEDIENQTEDDVCPEDLCDGTGFDDDGKRCLCNPKMNEEPDNQDKE